MRTSIDSFKLSLVLYVMGLMLIGLSFWRLAQVRAKMPKLNVIK